MKCSCRRLKDWRTKLQGKQSHWVASASGMLRYGQCRYSAHVAPVWWHVHVRSLVANKKPLRLMSPTSTYASWCTLIRISEAVFRSADLAIFASVELSKLAVWMIGWWVFIVQGLPFFFFSWKFSALKASQISFVYLREQQIYWSCGGWQKSLCLYPVAEDGMRVTMVNIPSRENFSFISHDH